MQDGNVPGDGSASSSGGGGGGSGRFVHIFFAILLVSLVAVHFMYLRRPSEYPYRHQVDMRGRRTEVGLVDKAMEELYQGNRLQKHHNPHVPIYVQARERQGAFRREVPDALRVRHPGH